MKQVLQRSGLIEIVKIAGGCKTSHNSTACWAADDNHISRKKKKKKNYVKLQQQAPLATLGLLPDKSTDVSVLWIWIWREDLFSNALSGNALPAFLLIT